MNTMRARAAAAADVALVVIEAERGRQQQTAEVIQQADACGLPVVFVLNKVDKLLSPTSSSSSSREILSRLQALEVLGECGDGDETDPAAASAAAAAAGVPEADAAQQLLLQRMQLRRECQRMFEGGLVSRDLSEEAMRALPVSALYGFGMEVRQRLSLGACLPPTVCVSSLYRSLLQFLWVSLCLSAFISLSLPLLSSHHAACVWRAAPSVGLSKSHHWHTGQRKKTDAKTRRNRGSPTGRRSVRTLARTIANLCMFKYMCILCLCVYRYLIRRLVHSFLDFSLMQRLLRHLLKLTDPLQLPLRMPAPLTTTPGAATRSGLRLHPRFGTLELKSLTLNSKTRIADPRLWHLQPENVNSGQVEREGGVCCLAASLSHHRSVGQLRLLLTVATILASTYCAAGKFYGNSISTCLIVFGCASVVLFRYQHVSRRSDCLVDAHMSPSGIGLILDIQKTRDKGLVYTVLLKAGVIMPG